MQLTLYSISGEHVNPRKHIRNSIQTITAIYVFNLLFFPRGRYLSLSRARRRSCRNSTRPRGTGARRKTVELRDWRVSGNRTAGAIRLTSRFTGIIPRPRSPRGRGTTKFRSSSRDVRGEPAGERYRVSDSRAIRTKRKVMGLTWATHESARRPN